MGALALVHVLLVLSAVGFGLAWHVRPPPWLVAVACASSLLVGTAAAVAAAGLVNPLRGFA